MIFIVLDLGEDQLFAWIQSHLWDPLTPYATRRWMIFIVLGLGEDQLLLGFNLIYLPCVGNLTRWFHTA